MIKISLVALALALSAQQATPALRLYSAEEAAALADAAATNAGATAGNSDTETACSLLAGEHNRLLEDRAQSAELQAMLSRQIADASVNPAATEQTRGISRLLERLLDREALAARANERTRVTVDIALTSLCR